jgi:hypothetical protein
MEGTTTTSKRTITVLEITVVIKGMVAVPTKTMEVAVGSVTPTIPMEIINVIFVKIGTLCLHCWKRFDKNYIGSEKGKYGHHIIKS